MEEREPMAVKVAHFTSVHELGSENPKTQRLETPSIQNKTDQSGPKGSPDQSCPKGSPDFWLRD